VQILSEDIPPAAVTILTPNSEKIEVIRTLQTIDKPTFFVLTPLSLLGSRTNYLNLYEI